MENYDGDYLAIAKAADLVDQLGRLPWLYLRKQQTVTSPGIN